MAAGAAAQGGTNGLIGWRGRGAKRICAKCEAIPRKAKAPSRQRADTPARQYLARRHYRPMFSQ
jgi:hypothetical protein